MNRDPNATELLDLLKESREYTQYFAELGVETIALPGDHVKSELSHSLHGTLVVEPSTQRIRPSEPELPQPPVKAPIISNPPQPTSLFGGLTATQPAPLQSTESMEDVWRDIGDCTRCGLCEGRTQVVNTYGNHKARLMFVGEAQSLPASGQSPADPRGSCNLPAFSISRNRGSAT